MKNLFPIASLSLAVAAFALGWGMKPAHRRTASSEPAGRNPGDDTLQLRTTDSVRSGTVSATPDSDDAVDRVSDSGAPAAMGTGAQLTGLEISELGQRWKSSRDPLERRQLFLQMLAGMTKENARQIRAQIAHLPAGHPDFRDFHYAWGSVAGAEAVLHGRETAKRDMAAALAGWAAADPDAATAFYRDLPGEGYPLGDLHQGLVHGLANRSPDLAAEYIYGLAQAGELSAEPLLRIVTNKMIASRGLQGAVQWSQTLPDALGEVAFRRPDGGIEPVAMRAAAMKHVTGEFARRDPAAAADWVSANVQPDQEPWVIHELGKNWAMRQPVEAVNWLQGLEDSRGQREGFSSAYAVWGSRDPMAASRHIAELPESVERDWAINGFTAALAHRDPESAVIWAEEISTPGLREAAVVRAAKRYYQEEPTAASAWLSGSSLSDEARRRVLASPGGTGG